MQGSKIYKVIDLHAGGEPARLVVEGAPNVPGKSMFEKRQHFIEKYDWFRKLLLLEPRGYPCQNANILYNLETSEEENLHPQYGFVIMEQNKIYPLMSGHNTICVATALLETGRIAMEEPITKFELETPGGVIGITADCEAGKAKSIRFRGVASFVAHMDVIVNVPHLGNIAVDIAYGGMWYTIVDADLLKLELTPKNAKVICKFGEMIKVASREQYPVEHPDNKHRGCEIMVFRSVISSSSKLVNRNTVVMSNGTLDWNDDTTWTGMIDRSPCGTGTCAVMAVLHARGILKLGQEFVHESIIGSVFIGKLIEETMVASYKAVVPTITGSAWITAISDLVVHPTDPFPQGFTVSDIWC